MGDNAEHRDGRSSADDSGAVDDPPTQTDVKASPVEFSGGKPE